VRHHSSGRGRDRTGDRSLVRRELSR